MEARQAASIEGKWRKTMWNGASGTVYVSALLALRLEEESRDRTNDEVIMSLALDDRHPSLTGAPLWSDGRAI